MAGNLYTVDNLFIIVTGAAVAAYQELAATPAGAPDRFCPAVPGEVAWDECECGLFVQTIQEVVPSSNFPTPAADQRTTACGPALVIVTVQASILRCVSTVADGGNPPPVPTCATLLAESRTLEEDRIAVRRGITCFLRAQRDAYRILDFSVGAQSTLGPQGMCAGSIMPYRFALSNFCCD